MDIKKNHFFSNNLLYNKQKWNISKLGFNLGANKSYKKINSINVVSLLIGEVKFKISNK